MQHWGKWIRTVGLLGLAAWGCAPPVLADSITFSGLITQSTLDGTGPAVDNPSLR